MSALIALSSELHESSKTSPKKALENIRHLLKNRDASLLVVRDGSEIAGMATLFVLQKIPKRVASVEDVIVSGSYRGRGIGEKLMKAIIQEAKRRGVSSIYLTSRPSRVAANKLYSKLGFKKRETNVYRLSF